MTGRREANKAEKRAAIARAAATLFASRGYGHTTTQEIATAADVATGTVFVYARTKPELLLLALNEELGAHPPRPGRGGPAASVVATLEPLIGLAQRQPENVAVFVREVFFGVDGPEREIALGHLRDYEATIAALLGRHVDRGLIRPDADLRLASRAILSTLLLELIRTEVRTDGDQTDVRTRLRAHVELLLRGLYAPVAPE